jgi:hypothetical protein
MEKEIIEYESSEHLFYDMENDIERYSLPIEFDPYEEVNALWRREQKLKNIAQRWFSIYGTIPNPQNKNT